MASLSHELNNVFAIINEHNGLLEDMLAGLKQGMPLDEKKIQRSSQKIGYQVERGKELIKRLNQFAHSTDHAVMETEITQWLQAIVALSQRLAGMKEMIIEFKASPGETIFLNTNPYYLQQAVFICFQVFMANCEANRLITVAAEKAEGMLSLTVAGSAINDDEFTRDKLGLLKILLEQLNGNLEIKSRNGQNYSIILKLRELKIEV